MSIIAAPNYVVIRPIGDPTMSGNRSLVAHEWMEEHLNRPCVGVVVAAPEALYYGGHRLAELGRRPAGRDLVEAQRINEKSLDFDVPMEIQVGDKVIFRYLANIEDPASDAWLGDLLVLRYDDLIARVDESVNMEVREPWSWETQFFFNQTGLALTDGKVNLSLYPLNGRVLLEVEREEKLAGSLYLRGDRSLTEGRVVATGALIGGYKLWPFDPGDTEYPLEGKRVVFVKHMAVRVEHDSLKVLDYGRREFPLYYTERRWIQAVLDES